MESSESYAWKNCIHAKASIRKEEKSKISKGSFLYNLEIGSRRTNYIACYLSCLIW